MVQSLSAAIEDAVADATATPGMGLRQVRAWYAIPARDPSAAAAWAAACYRRPGDRHPPRGAPVFYAGGSHGFGHIAMALGDGTVRSTDAGGRGRVATVALDWPEHHCGLSYVGWTADLEGTVIPELLDIYFGHSWGQGTVELDELRYGQEDSDSVRRLQHVLNTMTTDHPHPRLPVTGNYLEMTDATVRAWQDHIGAERDRERASFIRLEQAELLLKQPLYTIR